MIYHKLVPVIGILSILLALSGIKNYFYESSLCEVPQIGVSSLKLPFVSENSKFGNKYHLYFLKASEIKPEYTAEQHFENLGGIPILFLPGNAGSYAQAFTLVDKSAKYPKLDFFSVDFDADFSAFHGKTVIEETVFVNDAIAFILNQYKDHTNPPTSVTIISHSMGGIIARGLPALDNYNPKSIETIITMSSPHVFPPLSFDRDIVQLYDLVNKFWRKNNEIALISISGGHNDLMVLPDSTIAESLGGITLFTTGISNFYCTADHLSIMWCPQIIEKLVSGLLGLLEPTNLASDVESKQTAFKAIFMEKPVIDPSTPPQLVSSKIYMLFPAKYTTSNPAQETLLKLPSQSSLFSYKVSGQHPFQLAHYTSKEYRKYGKQPEYLVNDATIMWYSSGPHVPLPAHANQDQLILEIKSDQVQKIQVRVAWRATLANAFMHYRSLSACWPLGILVFCMLMLMLRNEDDFTASIWRTMQKGVIYMPLSLIICHILLKFGGFRYLACLLQYPGESDNITTLSKMGFIVHDMLLGVFDLKFMVFIPILWSAAFLMFISVHYLCYYTLNLRITLTKRMRKSVLNEKYIQITKGKYHLNKQAILLTLLALFGLYLVPYQITTVLLTIFFAFVADPQGFALIYLEILVWISIINAPIFLVWFDNLRVNWMRNFATIRNLEASLPLILYIASGTPCPKTQDKRLQYLNILVCGYFVLYAFVYGSMHAFMLHHLTCYLSIWMLAVTYDSKKT